MKMKRMIGWVMCTESMDYHVCILEWHFLYFRLDDFIAIIKLDNRV
jgi:hypothetical protein